MQIPPGLQHLSSHHFGHLHLWLQPPQHLPLTNYRLLLLGGHTDWVPITSRAQMKIVTNMWHMYMYLSDMMSIQIELNNGQYTCTYHYQLVPKSHIMTCPPPTNFINNTTEHLKLYEGGRKVAQVVLHMQLQFDRQIHEEIQGLVCFEELPIFEGISPIASQHELPRQPPSRITTIHSPEKEKKEEFDIDEESKMMEDEIDRMVSQMHSKPYDSSRYLNEQPPLTSPTAYIPTQPPHLQHPPAQPPKPSRNRSKPKSPNFSCSQTISPTSVIPKGEKKQIKLHIHQILTTQPEPYNTLSLKLYLNRQPHQYMTMQGIKQGESIVFNQAIKLTQQVDVLTFLMSDEYGMNYGEATFELSRLYTTQQQRGIFNVSIVRREEEGVVKVRKSMVQPVVPVQRSLRIEVQAVEKVEMVQVYLHMSGFGFDYSLMRYKIPSTKQTIEFTTSEHINIFPHHSSHDRLLLQAWNQEQIVGQCEISLKSIKGTNMNVINASIDPIYLYDGCMEVRDVFDGGRKVGTFYLCLCYGGVKQVHALLNKSQNKQSAQMKGVEVRVDDKLGIYVKESKKKVEAEVQVEIPVQKEDSINQFMHVPTYSQYPPFQQLQQQQEQQYQQEKKKEEVKEEKVKEEKVKEKQETQCVRLEDKICERVLAIIQPILPQLERIKQLCQPHLLYNFISIPTLMDIFRQATLDKTQIHQLYTRILTQHTNNQLININIIYDYCTSAIINGQINPTLLSNSLIVHQALLILYSQQPSAELTPDTQFVQVKQMYSRIGYKISLHEYECMGDFLRGRSEEQCLGMRESILAQMAEYSVVEMKKCMHETDIMEILYGGTEEPDSSHCSHISQPVEVEESTVMKAIEETQFTKTVPMYQQPTQYTNILSVEGIENVKESTECLLDIQLHKAELKVIIEHPTYEQIPYQADTQQNICSSMEVEEIQGRVELCNKGGVVAGAAFVLIKGLKSMYAMKTQKEEFCGLLSLQLC